MLSTITNLIINKKLPEREPWENPVKPTKQDFYVVRIYNPLSDMC